LEIVVYFAWYSNFV